MRHVLILGVLLLVMGAVSANSPSADAQPRWYRWTIPLGGLAGLAASSLLLAPRG